MSNYTSTLTKFFLLTKYVVIHAYKYNLHITLRIFQNLEHDESFLKTVLKLLQNSNLKNLEEPQKNKTKSLE